MSISPLSTNLVSDLSQQHRQNPFQQIQQDFKQLASALQSGNLSDAQSAYSSIQQLLGGNQNSANSNTGSNGSSTIQNDFAALGQALQSGDLTQAQSAFSQLQSDAQTARQANQNQWQAAAQDQFVSSASQNAASQTLSPAEQVQQDYTQLANALQSGNLTNAQAAFTALQQVLQTQTGTNTASSTTSTTNSTSSQDPILNDFNALGQALSSGNLSQAQSAFAQLQSDVQAAQQSTATQAQSLSQALKTAVEGHHHHHHGGGDHDGGGASTQSSSSQSSTTPSTTSSGNVNIYG
jgi:DNA-binding FadR family transcriptional regulator